MYSSISSSEDLILCIMDPLAEMIVHSESWPTLQYTINNKYTKSRWTIELSFCCTNWSEVTIETYYWLDDVHILKAKLLHLCYASGVINWFSFNKAFGYHFVWLTIMVNKSIPYTFIVNISVMGLTHRDFNNMNSLNI